MTTDELLAILADRGLSVAWKGERPVLKGDRSQATPTLLAALRFHRGELLRRFPPPPPRRPREWLLASDAFPLAVEGQPFIMPADCHPPSALAWRHVGEREWVRLAVPEPSDA